MPSQRASNNRNGETLSQLQAFLMSSVFLIVVSKPPPKGLGSWLPAHTIDRSMRGDGDCYCVFLGEESAVFTFPLFFRGHVMSFSTSCLLFFTFPGHMPLLHFYVLLHHFTGRMVPAALSRGTNIIAPLYCRLVWMSPTLAQEGLGERE